MLTVNACLVFPAAMAVHASGAQLASLKDRKEAVTVRAALLESLRTPQIQRSASRASAASTLLKLVQRVSSRVMTAPRSKLHLQAVTNSQTVAVSRDSRGQMALAAQHVCQDLSKMLLVMPPANFAPRVPTFPSQLLQRVTTVRNTTTLLGLDLHNTPNVFAMPVTLLWTEAV